MRLFHIFLFFLIFVSFAGFASQKKVAINKIESNIKVYFFTTKKNIGLNDNLKSENDHLQKDFISSATSFKIHPSIFILFLFSAFVVLILKAINTKIFMNKLDNHYRCLFKILYPKHVFW